MKLLTRVGVLLACTAAAAGADDVIDAGVLRHVPDRAGLVLIVPSIAGLDAGVTEFGRACSVVEIGVDSLAGEVMTSSAGVQRAGGLVLAGLPAEPVEWVLICRLEDEAAWRSANGVTRPNSDSADGDQKSGVFTASFLGADGQGEIRDGVLILASRPSGLDAALHATGGFASDLDARRRGLPESSQIMLLANVAAWRDFLDQRIALADALAQTAFMMSGGAGARPHIELWRELSQSARWVVSEAKTAAASLQIDGDGARLRTVVSFPPGGSPADVEPPRGNLLSGLPSGEFALATGCDLGNAPLSRGARSLVEWMSNLVARQEVPAGMAAAWRDAESANLLVSVEDDIALAVAGVVTNEPRQWAAAVVEMLRSASWSHRSEPAPRDALDVLTSPALGHADSDAAERAARKVFGNAPELWISAGGPAAPDASGKADHGEGAANDEPEGAGRVCLALGPPDRVAARMKKIAGGGGTPLSVNTRVRRAVEALPESPHALLLIDAGPMFALTVRVAQTFGAPIPALPLRSTYAPLIPMGGWLEPQGFRGEVLLPSATVREMIDSLRPGSAADRAY